MGKLYDDVMNSYDVRSFTKHVIREGLTKDPLDAVRDCELALRVLEERLHELELADAMDSVKG